ncbi:MAG: hypothetical protein AB8B60_08665 [Sulfitobacter sp.]
MSPDPPASRDLRTWGAGNVGFALGNLFVFGQGAGTCNVPKDMTVLQVFVKRR